MGPTTFHPHSRRRQGLSSDIRSIGKHALVYGTGIAVNRLAGFIMLPIYTRFLSPADYGILELVTLTVDFIGTIASIGIANAVFKFYADAVDPEDQRRMIGTAEMTLVALALLACLAGQLASPTLGRTILEADRGPLYFRLFFVIYLLQTCETIPLLYLRIANRSTVFVLVNVAKLIVALGLNIYFVVVLRLGVVGVLYSSLTASALFSTGLTIYLVRRVGLEFSRAACRTLVKFGAPMVLWFIGNFVVIFSDRYFLKHFSTDASVGVYSLAYRFAMLITAFGFQPFELVWAPQSFQIAKQPDGMDTIRRVFGYLTLLLCVVGLMIGLFSREVIRIMTDPAFASAARIVPLLLGAQIFYHWVTFPNLSLLITERTRTLGALAVLVVAVVVALNFALIPRYGAMGAASATLIAYAIRFLIVLTVAQRIYRLEYGWPLVARTLLLCSGLLVVKYLTPDTGILAGLALSSGLAALGLLLVYGWIMDARERALARDAMAVALTWARTFRTRRFGESQAAGSQD